MENIKIKIGEKPRNISEDIGKLQEMKNELEKYKRKSDYLNIIKMIFSKRKKNLDRKIRDYDKRYRELYEKYKTGYLSEKDCEEVLILNKEFSELWNRYDLLGRLEKELFKKSVDELTIEAEKQYTELLKEIKQ